jgi:nitrogen-specific signal transduction histidine kinase
VHLSVGKLTVAGATKFTGTLHDLSARVRIEAQLREQASLARIGEMAAVIAHEVKNPLAGVRGAIQVIGTRLPKDSKNALMVKEIVSRIDALNDLMKDLLLFARPPAPKAAQWTWRRWWRRRPSCWEGTRRSRTCGSASRAPSRKSWRIPSSSRLCS